MLHRMSRGSFFRIPTDEARVILDRNISNYHSIDKPQNGQFSIYLPSEYQLRELISVMSSEWLEESELSSDVIRLDTPSISIRCAYNSDRFNALYNPVVGINIMYESFCNTPKFAIFQNRINC